MTVWSLTLAVAQPLMVSAVLTPHLVTLANVLASLDAAVLAGCGEALLLVQGDIALPVFDTTALHAGAGVDFITGPGALAC